MTTLRVLLHVAAQRDYELHSLDFSTAFLQGSLHEEIWLRGPSGFTGSFPAGTQWSLPRPVYGLRQAPREWHDTLRTTLAALGFAPSTADPSLFLRTDTSLPPFYVLVYLDDLLFATADTEALTLVNSELQKRHTCTDLVVPKHYSGMVIALPFCLQACSATGILWGGASTCNNRASEQHVTAVESYSGPSGSGGVRGAGEVGRGSAGGSAPIASVSTPAKDDVKAFNRYLYVKLSAAGIDNPEKIKCYKALSLLPESWGHLVVNLNGMKDSWSLEWICAQVLQEEFRRKELTAAAGEGGGSAYGMKGFNGRGSKKGKAKEGSGREHYSGGKRSNKGGKRCGGKCSYCHDMVVLASKVALHCSSHWVIITGAFMTMTNREDLLDEVRPSKAATVVSATGQVVPVHGEGRAMFMGADGRLVGLKRVLLIPGLCANLLSTKALSEAGMKMEMMGTKVFKATLDGRLLWDLRGGKDMHRSMWEIPVLPWKEAAARLAAEAVRGGHASHVTSGGGGDGSDGGLLVHGGVALPRVTPSTGETDWLTAHRRFGHVALPLLQQLFKEERVKGLRIKGEPKEVSSCETCLTSKFSRYPFHLTVGQSSDLVELVHVDLVRPMKVKGDGGALYSMTMVDDYTKLTWSFPLAKKSDAARVIIEEWLPMVERESGKRVKAIRSDRGGEFLGADFRS
ncbi:unnamed protein product [Closterium sp. NIES-53]